MRVELLAFHLNILVGDELDSLSLDIQSLDHFVVPLVDETSKDLFWEGNKTEAHTKERAPAVT